MELFSCFMVRFVIFKISPQLENHGLIGIIKVKERVSSYSNEFKNKYKIKLKIAILSINILTIISKMAKTRLKSITFSK